MVSHEPVPDAGPRQSIVTSGTASAVSQARLAAGPDKDVAVMGGATITAALLAVNHGVTHLTYDVVRPGPR